MLAAKTGLPNTSSHARTRAFAQRDPMPHITTYSLDLEHEAPPQHLHSRHSPRHDQHATLTPPHRSSHPQNPKSSQHDRLRGRHPRLTLPGPLSLTQKLPLAQPLGPQTASPILAPFANIPLPHQQAHTPLTTPITPLNRERILTIHRTTPAPTTRPARRAQTQPAPLRGPPRHALAEQQYLDGTEAAGHRAAAAGEDSGAGTGG